MVNVRVNLGSNPLYVVVADGKLVTPHKFLYLGKRKKRQSCEVIEFLQQRYQHRLCKGNPGAVGGGSAQTVGWLGRRGDPK